MKVKIRRESIRGKIRTAMSDTPNPPSGTQIRLTSLSNCAG